MEEKRGPIEKGEKDWPINPFGVVALAAFAIVVIFLIVKPLVGQKTMPISEVPGNASGASIITPQAGELIKSQRLPIELSVDDPSKVEKVQFWAKTYADGKWQIIGEVNSAPFKLDWEMPEGFQNKAIALTSHIFTKDGNIIKDPGGWREGIIILSQ